MEKSHQLKMICLDIVQTAKVKIQIIYFIYKFI